MPRNGRDSQVESPDVEKPSMRRRASEGVSSLASMGCRRMCLRARIHSSRAYYSSFAVVAFCLCAKALYTTSVSLSDTDNTLSGFRKQPLMVQLLGENETRLELESSPPHLIQDLQNQYWINHGGVEWHNPLDVREEDGCVNMAEWQEEQHQSCLRIHEISFNDFHRGDQEQVRVVGDGNFRSVWMVREYDGTQRALKMLRYRNKNWNKTELIERWLERHRIDAVASEQLTASPHVADIYGYCANAALVDYAHGGNLISFIGSKNRTKMESLRVAYHVAAAVADAHHVDYRNRATIAHTDIKPDQFLLLNGVYKLNDFNRARLISWNPKRDKQCGFHFEENAGVYRAPEEYRYDQETEKIDVFTLGLVLYKILTSGAPFYFGIKRYKTYVKNGGRPNVTDPEILNSTHPYDTTLLKALDLCWTFDPEERPSARKIANLLHRTLEKLESESRP